MIIDIHTHVPPREQWEAFLGHCRRSGLAGIATSSLGVSGWPRNPTPEQVRAANEEACAFAEFAKSRLHVWWFVYVNPQHRDACDVIDWGVRRGASGVKLWVSVNNEAGSTDACLPVLRRATEHGLPVLIHTFNRTDGPLPGEMTLDEFADLARRFPDLSLIAAHSGGNWRVGLGALSSIPNACVDVCGVFPERGMVEALVDDLGPTRVLFGSDGPGRSVPAKVAGVLFSGLSREIRAQVFRKNALRVLGRRDLEAEPPGAAKVLEPSPEEAPAREVSGLPAEDHFCFCGEWPFAPDVSVGVAGTARALETAGFRRGYCVAFEALIEPSPRRANAALAAAARSYPILAPLAVVNPLAPDWRRVLKEGGQACGIWASPYIHQWKLDDPRAGEFFRRCSELRKGVWINCGLADHRFRPACAGWRPVSLEELTGFVRNAPPNTYVFQGLMPPETFAVYRAARSATARDVQVRFEVSRLVDYRENFLQALAEIGPERLLLGSEFPFRDARVVPWTAARMAEWLPNDGNRGGLSVS